MRDLAPCIFLLSFPARFPFAAGCRFKARGTFSPFLGNAIKTWEFVAHLHRLFFHFYLQLSEEIAAFLGKSNLLLNWKSLGHLDPRKTLIFGISGYYSHVILSHSIWGGGGTGIGRGVRENNAFCFLLRMSNLLTGAYFFHNGGMWKVTAPI